MKTYKIIFHKKAKKEFDKMDNSIKILILKQLKKLSTHPDSGKSLGNKYGIDLTGYRKIYVDNKKFRIVYKIIEEKIEIFVIGIGIRDKNKIYELINKRL